MQDRAGRVAGCWVVVGATIALSASVGCDDESVGGEGDSTAAVQGPSSTDVPVEAGPAADPCDGAGCDREGRCTPGDAGGCVAGLSEDCKQSWLCKDWGLCSAYEGRCIAVETEDCRRAWSCRLQGRCTAKHEKCIVASDADCGRSELCKLHRQCRERNGWCARTKRAPKPKKDEEKDDD